MIKYFLLYKILLHKIFFLKKKKISTQELTAGAVGTTSPLTFILSLLELESVLSIEIDRRHRLALPVVLSPKLHAIYVAIVLKIRKLKQVGPRFDFVS